MALRLPRFEVVQGRLDNFLEVANVIRTLQDRLVLAIDAIVGPRGALSAGLTVDNFKARVLSLSVTADGTYSVQLPADFNSRFDRVEVYDVLESDGTHRGCGQVVMSWRTSAREIQVTLSGLTPGTTSTVRLLAWGTP